MKTQHTPGPWRVQDNGEQGLNGRRITVHSHSGILADIDWNTLTQNRANAHLIAAAPELLEALKALVTWHDGQASNPPKDAWPNARAALDKASALT